VLADQEIKLQKKTL